MTVQLPDLQTAAIAPTERREFGRIVRFGAVGIVNTVITLAAFAVLVAAGCPAPAASALAFGAGAANGFFLNRRWTFAGLPRAPAAGARYTAIQALGAGLSAVGVGALQSLGWAHMTAECVILPCVTVTLYCLARVLVFQSEPR